VTPCIWLGTTHPCNPPHHGLWVNLHFFTMCIYKHCFLPMLLVFAMTCTKMPCPLPHNHYCCSLPSPVCLPHLLICTCLISSPTACPSSSVLCWCLLCFFVCFLFFLFFLIIVIRYISLWLHFGLLMYIFCLSFVIQLFLILLLFNSVLFVLQPCVVVSLLNVHWVNEW